MIEPKPSKKLQSTSPHSEVYTVLSKEIRNSHRQLSTKNDIQQMQFDQQQVRIYQKIRQAKSQLSTTFNNYKNNSASTTSLANIKKAGPNYNDYERKSKIHRENKRLYEQIVQIVKGKKGENASVSFERSPS
jgi:TolA-binding protein